ncbi:deoxyribodipyrimidine photo-lyase [Azovibrio restrictus]|uniref:cryptochrome/photolyase family protein n=1 Tax=Azovibrio restrictus TaxID=146938 RepID=UPI0026ED0994|nr:deoxyribodipyrimidine photo-lyase [Azovibrio restrictus]
MTAYDAALVWFRRDLRDHDHAALYRALQQARRVFCVFVFDTDILDLLPSRTDRRVEFIHGSVRELDAALRARGGGLLVLHGRAEAEIPRLARELGVQAVFANRDYEPAAKVRDARVAARLGEAGIAFVSPKDQVVFDGDEVLTQAGRPYTVFTPYRNAWLKKLAAAGGDFYLRPYPDQPAGGGALVPPPVAGLPELAELGFTPTNLQELGIRPGMSGARAAWTEFQGRMDRYKALRDFPAVKGVSYLSVHLRFGTLSIRELAATAWRQGGEGAETWLSELVWRDFYFMLLDHFPHVERACFKPEFDALAWDDWPEGLAAWQQGRTGYPLVDAAMAQLNQTGYMHNRLRMVVASFLTKDLGISWQAGERYFAGQLNDFDLAANNGGWQWAASTGCDAQPWFRIFNPVTQSEKFDPQGRFIRRYLPQLAALPDKYLHAPWTLPPLLQRELGVVIGQDYPAPIVDHAKARERTLARFEAVLGGLKRV